MTSASSSSDGVRVHIEALRKKLLDLSMRNRMLNYRPSKRLGIVVEGESSLEVNRILVSEGKKMSFLGKPDPPRSTSQQTDRPLSDYGDEVALSELRQRAEEELDGFLANAAMPVDQMDTKLNTSEYESVLQAKLRTIHREAELANQELGVNTLFLTLGVLEWRETDQRSYKAPLLFIPVTLEKQANGVIKVAHDGSDVGENLPLRAKLAEFNLKLPAYDDEKTILDYFAEVESTIRKREGWVVHYNEICFGFFNYEKYAMYVDLGGEAWPEDRKPWMNADIAAMLGQGYPSSDSEIHGDCFIDDFRPVAESNEVFDADSSQTLAMIRAKANLSIVVEGPPGTGKSQTITNIVAEAVADGKSVLFVSAKRAALEVVKRRLGEAELSDVCLDLHDKMTNRREFYSEIKRTVERSLQIRDEEQRVLRLSELRDRINVHSKAMNDELPSYGLTVFTAMCLLAALPKETAEDREGRVPFELLRALNHSDIQAATPLLQSLQSRLSATGVPERHPFRGAKIDYLDPTRRLDIEEALTSCAHSFQTAKQALEAASEAFHVNVPSTANDVRTLRACAERALAAPAHDGVALKTETWKSEEPAIRRVVECLRTRNRLREVRKSEVVETIWSVPIPPLAQTFERYADKWYKPFVGEFRTARNTLRAYLAPSGPASAIAQRDLLIDLRKIQEAEAEIRSHEGSVQRLFGVQWQGLDSAPEDLEQLLAWVLDLRNQIETGQLPKGLLDFFSGASHDPNLLALVEKAEEAANKAIADYEAAAQALEYPSENCRGENWQALTDRVDRWQGGLPDLAEFIAMNEARRRVSEKGLDSIVEIADRWPLAAERLTDAFLRSYYSGVVRDAIQEKPSLRTFERAGHEAAIAEFRDLDDFKLKYNRARVRVAHHRRIPSFGDQTVGNLHALKVQCNLQRAHKPIRWIMARAGEAIQRIKPVFMMSPLSAAIHLPPELPPFDVVIFDEASQVKPEDALCAIARAKQTIVVGDTRQMPPTSFFDRVADGGDGDGDGDDDGEVAEIAEQMKHLESILSLMSTVADGEARRPDLRWHYRSVHPSLIQPSNEMFYGNRLVVFPSPGTEQAGRRIGVVFHHHPETVYEGGAKKRINLQEAQLVANAVLDHVRNFPDESLMVAAMNKPQADLIYDEVAKLERLNPAPFNEFRNRHPHEKLDIKNLENVQGDERDVVYISVTYGRDPSGTIRQQFGPLLQDGGERRLNVLISRARRRCEIFSNITADDLRSDTQRAGVVSLKRYLRFAATGDLDIASPTGREEDSPFEQEVRAALHARGYEVHTQIGSLGYRIDLAVVDPRAPGRYLLGIECDGATYHSARSARDRDKLRQRVLEQRGWILHRIWSSDWWQDHDGEIARLLAAIETAFESDASPKLPEPIPDDEEEDFVEEAEGVRDSSPTRPYQTTPDPGDVQTEGQLASYLEQVVRHEGPIHRDLLLTRLREAAGYGRAGSNVRAFLEQFIDSAERSGQIRSLPDAYYWNDEQLAQMRDWTLAAPKDRRLEYLPKAELRNALRHVVGTSYGVDRDSAIRGMFNTLGYRRMTGNAISIAAPILDDLISEGVIEERSDVLYLAKRP